jgi:hypothetical protein
MERRAGKLATVASVRTWTIKGVSGQARNAVREAARRVLRGATAILRGLRLHRRAPGLVASAHQRAGLERARQARVLLRRSRCFDDAQKITIWPPIRRLVADAAIARSYLRVIARRSFLIAIPCAILFICFQSVSIVLWFYEADSTVFLQYINDTILRPPLSNHEVASFLFTSISISWVGITIISAPMLLWIRFYTRHISWTRRLIILTFFGISCITVSLLLDRMVNVFDALIETNISINFRIIVSSILLAAGAYLLITPTWILLWGQMSYVVELLLNRQSIESKIMVRLLNILVNTERYPQRWMNARFRAGAVLELENTANLIEKALPKTLRVREAATQEWAEQRFGEIAFAVRELEKWVMTPRQDTLGELQLQVAQRIVCIAVGNWDGLGRTPVGRVARAVRVARLKGYLSTMLLAATPFLILLVIQQSSLALSDQFRQFAVAGALLWAAITLLQIFDPMLRDRIAILKDIVGLVPGLGKGEKIP